MTEPTKMDSDAVTRELVAKLNEAITMLRKAAAQKDAKIAELGGALRHLCEHGGAMQWLEMHAPHIREECEAALSVPSDSVRFCFVRFGRKNGVFPLAEDSHNALTGQKEGGVSVYEAVERNGVYHILLPRIDPISIATLGMCFNVAQGLWGQAEYPLYEVVGDLVGFGSDGEPLLRNCRVVCRLFKQNAEM